MNGSIHKISCIDQEDHLSSIYSSTDTRARAYPNWIELAPPGGRTVRRPPTRVRTWGAASSYSPPVANGVTLAGVRACIDVAVEGGGNAAGSMDAAKESRPAEAARLAVPARRP